MTSLGSPKRVMLRLPSVRVHGFLTRNSCRSCQSVVGEGELLRSNCPLLNDSLPHHARASRAAFLLGCIHKSAKVRDSNLEGGTSKKYKENISFRDILARSLHNSLQNLDESMCNPGRTEIMKKNMLILDPRRPSETHGTVRLGHARLALNGRPRGGTRGRCGATGPGEVTQLFGNAGGDG